MLGGMRTLHLTTDDDAHLQRLLHAMRHFFVTFDQTEVRQEGVPYTFQAGGLIKELDRALRIVGWKPGDPLPPGLPFAGVSPHPLEPNKPGQ